MLDAGQQPLHHYIDASSKPEFPLGVWSEAYAARYGYEIVTLQGPVLIDEGDANPDDPAVLQAHSDCEAQLRGQEIPYYLHGDTGLGETAILGEVNNQVQSLLLADPDVLAAKEEWLTCLEDQGIAISNENDNIFPLVPEDKELEIEQALKDVACKEKVSLTSRYFDAQAQYEQALIEKNQSAFNTLAEKKESNLEEARRILALNGLG
ncbi:MAG: hypothetical protein SOR40_06970 [Rothia sp. (in: high G+C Gram-positive bacteria)]|nr:hypothetical protein [Rothia sp. (in: high G+C Gram-positive bacteria)]